MNTEQINPSKMSDIQIHCSHSEQVDIVKLVEHPSNPNQHNERQIKLLARIIQAQGWRNPITVSKKSGYIVSGHGRLKAAKELKVEKVPGDYQEFENEADEIAHLIADNRIAELSEFNLFDLNELAKELEPKIDLDFAGIDKLFREQLSILDIPGDNKEIDEIGMTHTENNCPKCGFKW